MLTRREMLKRTGQLGAALAIGGPVGCRTKRTPIASGVVLNDASKLNPTAVATVEQPGSLEEIQALVRRAARRGQAISVAGGRHAMGGQQFGADTLHLDTRTCSRVQMFDAERGLIEVDAGIQWPELLEYLHGQQRGHKRVMTIRQKQTGVDRVTLAGTLSANAHGRGLRFPPIVDDVESFVLVDATGEAHRCSRNENAELFSLAIGGYGLLGIIARVTLRLVPRRKIERVVEVIDVRDLVRRVEERIGEGFEYGDCQYATDFSMDDAVHRGVFSCYRPIEDGEGPPVSPRRLSPQDWTRLVYLAHVDKKKAFEVYADHYMATSGQTYWSDTHQLSNTLSDYHATIDRQLGTTGSEMIMEVYVPPEALMPFLGAARQEVREHGINLIYGTIRFIEPDDTTFLAWARDRSVCVLCNLHVDHTPAGLEKSAADARRILDRVVEHGGRYYLTYHRWATREQVERCYPQFVEFLKLKRRYDPQERFQSTWYRHYRSMFEDRLAGA